MPGFAAWVAAMRFFSGAPTPGSGPTESGGVTRCLPNTVTLDGYTFAVDLKTWRSGPQDTFRDTITDGGKQTSDSLFNARGAWARYRYSWHHGAGQDLGDFDDEADAYRSRAISHTEWSTKYQARLAPGTELSKASAASNLVFCRSADYAFLGAGTALFRTADFITWTTCTAPGGTVQALATDGSDLYVATSTGLVTYVGTATTPTAFATPVSGNCTNVAFCSNRLIVAVANVISEVAGVGTLTTIKTHFQSAFRWTTIFNIGSRIYIGGFAGSRSELYTVSTDSAGALVQSQEAAPLPVGELLRGALPVAGAAALLSNKGVRVAEVSGDGTLTYGALIEESGDTYCAAAEGRFLYAGWSVLGDGRSGVLQLALDDDVLPLQPAYGMGVAATALGTVRGIVRLGGLTAFCVDGSGVWVETTDTWEGEGSISSGKVLFGTVEAKALTTIDVAFAPLNAGESVNVSIVDENGVTIGGGVTSTTDETQLTVDLAGEVVTAVEVIITLGGDGTSSPTLYRWRVRGYPIAPPVLQWVIGLMVDEKVVVNIGEGYAMSMDVDAMHTWIEQLWAVKQYTILRIGQREYRVRVDNFEWQPVKWTSDGEVPQGTLVVQLIDA